MSWPIILRVVLYSHELQVGIWMIFVAICKVKTMSWVMVSMSWFMSCSWVEKAIRQILRVAQNASYFKLHSVSFLRIKVIIFHYSHNSTGHSQFQNIMRDKKSHKNRLRWNLLVFYTETCWTFCSQTTQWNVYIGRIGNYQMSWNLIFIVSTLFAVNFLGTYFSELTFWKMY